jgi:Fe2+ or Zn2+ uptake regulation protein
MTATLEPGVVHGLRMTPQRRAVLEAIAACSSHPTAAEIFVRVRQIRPGIAHATVYNALHALVQQGQVLQLSFGDGASRYDRRTDRHDHALCLDCGALVDVPAARPSRAARRAAEASGFVLHGQHTQFYGRCPTCLDTSRRSLP